MPKRSTPSLSPGGSKKQAPADFGRSIREWLQLGQLRSEKCEMSAARECFLEALRLVDERPVSDSSVLIARMEAISGLLRIAGEALDEAAMSHWEKELDSLMRAHPDRIPAIAWYCKGAIARHRNDLYAAQRYFHSYLRLARSHPETASFGTVGPEEAVARGWMMLAVVLWSQNKTARAAWLAEVLLRNLSGQRMPTLHGMLAMLLGGIAGANGKFAEALSWYQRAHASFLEAHNWYYYLYVLLGHARIARLQRNYVQSYWYLDLLDRATPGSDFGVLKREIAYERSKLQEDAVDLLIDSRQCVIRTREGGEISLGKQYVLLNILEALSEAHRRAGDDRDRGLSKAEIIQQVWNESYRPEAHDNKLYYNINRLRKLIEPDIRKPQYLLNWREGYRLAPGLKVQFVGGKSTIKGKEGGNNHESNHG